MGKFVVSRTESGVCFCLLAENGRRLAASRTYATLDACKKGIASLIVNAPQVPLVDSSAGEYGKNPKFEVVKEGDGYGFLLKSANGKSVLTSPVYATKKACLRAIAMVRSGVVGASVMLAEGQDLVPLTMTAQLSAVGAVVAEPRTPASESAVLSQSEPVLEAIQPDAEADEQSFDAEDTTTENEPVAIDEEKQKKACPLVATQAAAATPTPKTPRHKSADKGRGVGKRRVSFTAKNLSLALKKTSQDIADLIFWRK